MMSNDYGRKLWYSLAYVKWFIINDFFVIEIQILVDIFVILPVILMTKQ